MTQAARTVQMRLFCCCSCSPPRPSLLGPQAGPQIRREGAGPQPAIQRGLARVGRWRVQSDRGSAPVLHLHPAPLPQGRTAPWGCHPSRTVDSRQGPALRSCLCDPAACSIPTLDAGREPEAGAYVTTRVPERVREGIRYLCVYGGVDVLVCVSEPIWTYPRICVNRAPRACPCVHVPGVCGGTVAAGLHSPGSQLHAPPAWPLPQSTLRFDRFGPQLGGDLAAAPFASPWGPASPGLHAQVATRSLVLCTHTQLPFLLVPHPSPAFRVTLMILFLLEASSLGRDPSLLRVQAPPADWAHGMSQPTPWVPRGSLKSRQDLIRASKYTRV